MTELVSVKVLGSARVAIVWPTGSSEIHDLGELKDLLNLITPDSSISARSIGIVAVLFAALGLWRVGTELTRSNILRSLDEYYVVLQSEEMNVALQEGIEEGINKINELRHESREHQLQHELQKLI